MLARMQNYLDPDDALDLYGYFPYKAASGMTTMPNQQTRTARLEARISPDMLDVVKRAAEIQGRSVSDFVVAAAQEAAQRTIENTTIMRISVEDQRAMMEAILNPPEPNEALRKAADAHKRLVVETR
ncbi:DUF1778 domain-containing protein [Mesorhizobium sp. M0984]|uniref:type II toxin-antitoxin system TacA family antitoxin n=2 Tax=Mesorhizobium TaxID=68287 RepID=UPI00333A46C5